MSEPGLGRVSPPDFEHVDRYPLRAHPVGVPEPVGPVEEAIPVSLSRRRAYNQASYSACVGFSKGYITSHTEGGLIDALALWNRAKELDGIPWTNPGDNEGTTLRAGYEARRHEGVRRLVWDRKQRRYVSTEPDPATKLQSYWWATTVAEIRAAVAAGFIVQLGINWYRGDSNPIEKDGAAWVNPSRGSLQGGHAIDIRRVSDRLEAFGMVQTWGLNYGDNGYVLIPMREVEQRLAEDGEAGVVLDVGQTQ